MPSVVKQHSKISNTQPIGFLIVSLLSSKRPNGPARSAYLVVSESLHSWPSTLVIFPLEWAYARQPVAQVRQIDLRCFSASGLAPPSSKLQRTRIVGQRRQCCSLADATLGFCLYCQNLATGLAIGIQLIPIIVRTTLKHTAKSTATHPAQPSSSRILCWRQPKRLQG